MGARISGGLGLNNMKQTYIFEYLDENEFRKKERSVRKYNMLAYKKLMFNYYPTMRDGKFLGKLTIARGGDGVSACVCGE